ncbi:MULTISPECIES: Mu transposase C-terminal domain-containing protein [unclassified Caulobacter]|uniref:Mu transposase C-terminal domain-containing protein n=1 Tax=unclassified Caulobacter TaxID=2648921 RepID=UPI0009E96AFF
MSKNDPPLPSCTNISQETFDHLAHRLRSLQGLPKIGERTRRDVEAAALETGVHATTIYRSLSRITGKGTVQDLCPKPRGFPKGRSRLNARQEALISQYLLSDYLNASRPSLAKVARRIGGACEDEKLPRPSRAAIIRRLKNLPKRTVVRKRYGAKAAERQTPRPGQYVVAEPWAVWQIDHTLADVIVVDAEGRPIGRPWLTVIIDVCTRMVVAFYFGLDPPSSIRVAATLDLAISNKDHWLSARGLEYLWPCEGFPRLMHSDRAKEFQTTSLRNALLNHGVEWFLRPPGGARYGAHIERLIGTLMGECRLLPGATYNNPKARGSYDSKSAARLNIDDLDRYFSHQILGVYHNTIHSALGKTPMQAWLEKASEQLPRHPDDSEKFRLDLFPEEDRVITRQGIRLFCDEYYSHEIGDLYISGVRAVKIKYDPRNLSQIYVRDPHGRYLTVPYRFKRNSPPTTLWLLKTARRTIRQTGVVEHDRHTTKYATEMAEKVVTQAARRSDRAARNIERLKRDRGAAEGLFRTVKDAPRNDDDWGGAFEGEG